METTLLGLALPSVLQELKKILVKQGFLVQIVPTPNPVIVAIKKGGWFSKSKQLVLEISSENQNMTRIDITAIVDKKNNTHAEEILEENFVTTLYNNFKKVIQRPYGI